MSNCLTAVPWRVQSVFCTETLVAAKPHGHWIVMRM